MILGKSIHVKPESSLDEEVVLCTEYPVLCTPYSLQKIAPRVLVLSTEKTSG